MKRFLFALAVVALMAGLGRFAALAIDADPNQPYDVAPAAGAWMICAASYSGDEAGDTAHRLVLDIRRNYGLPAYVFNRGRDERAKQQAEIDRIHKLCPEGRVRIVRIEEQYAVLVGGYKDMDSARKALDGFKKLRPTDTKTMDIVQWVNQESGKNGEKEVTGHTIAYVNPFMRSFVVRNPTAPAEPVKNDGREDKFLRDMNSGESYSVYKCRKPWTLAVAVFQSQTIVQGQAASSSFLDKLKFTSNGDNLTAAAMSAHNLAEALEKLSRVPEYREAFKEVYVFHTRNNSVVTIGGFDGRDDPRMGYLQTILSKRLKPDTQVQLLKQPLPMEVPH